MSFSLPILTDLSMSKYLISEVKDNKNECECRVITIHSVLAITVLPNGFTTFPEINKNLSTDFQRR